MSDSTETALTTTEAGNGTALTWTPPEWIAGRSIHPAAGMFPMMEGVDLDELIESIKTYGLRDPVELIDGKVIDGRNRLKACEAASIEADVRDVGALVDDPYEYVLTKNLHRRHLDKGQRAMIAARMKDHFVKQAKERQQAGGGDKKSGKEKVPDPIENTGQARDQAGAALGVSGKLVDHAETVLKNGDPDLIKDVDTGKTSVSKAATSLKKTATGEPRSRHHTGSSNGEWYTPSEHVEKVRKVLGDIDLDPASCAKAQETVKADQYYDTEADGLAKPWNGRVFLNPPYQMPLVDKFVGKLCDAFKSLKVTAAILLVNNSIDTKWWHRAAESCNAFCLTRGRIQFVATDGTPIEPTQGQTLFYFGCHADRFVEEFADVGLCVKTSADNGLTMVTPKKPRAARRRFAATPGKSAPKTTRKTTKKKPARKKTAKKPEDA